MSKSMGTTKVVEKEIVTKDAKVEISEKDEKLIQENKELKEEIKRQNKTIEEQSASFSEELAKIKEMLLAKIADETCEEDKENYEEDVMPNYENVYIRPDKYIRIMSLTYGILNLNAGNGKIIKFDKFGDVRNIPYSDVSTIVINHQTLSESGGFYIFDEQAVHTLGLREHYENIIDKKGIEELINKDSKELKEILSGLSQYQKKAVVNTATNKIVNGENISTLIVSTINEVCNVDIMAMADDMLNYDEVVKEIEQSK